MSGESQTNVPATSGTAAAPAASSTSVASAKRPLEDPSSDAGPADQPEAKRPALDKEGSNGGPTHAASASRQAATAAKLPLPANGSKNGTPPNNPPLKEPTVPSASAVASLPQPATQPIPSSVNETGHAIQATIPEKQQDETQWLHIRAIISSGEAATLIGKGGENVTAIRKASGAKCTVSDYSKGAVERILTVSGLVDAVAKAFGLIIRTLNNEPLGQPSNAQSKVYPLRLLIPHLLVGAIIGQKGVRIREIQEESSARLTVSDACLPLSSERSLVVLGVADAAHIATYYVGSTLVEQLTEKFGGPAASAYATRHGTPAGVAPGGLQVVPYHPQAVGGQWGPANTFQNTHTIAPRAQQPQPPYGTPHAYGAVPHPMQQQHHHQAQQHPHAHQHLGYHAQHPQHPATPIQPQAPMQYGAQPRHGYGGAAPQYAGAYGQAPQQGMQPQGPMSPAGGPGASGTSGQAVTQQIYIPNDMVGAIIGKGGAKINEIRNLSGSTIKINEPQDNSNERLVTITGTAECNHIALWMLHQKLESEKHRI